MWLSVVSLNSIKYAFSRPLLLTPINVWAQKLRAGYAKIEISRENQQQGAKTAQDSAQQAR